MIPCTKPGCCRWFRNKSGLTQHVNIYHPVFPPINIPVQVEQPDQVPSPEEEQFQFRPDDDDYSDPSTSPSNPTLLAEFVGQGNCYDTSLGQLNMGEKIKYLLMYYLTGQPCDSSGNPLPVGQLSLQTPSEKQPNDWSPYSSCLEFELADFLFTCSWMSAANINESLDLWNVTLLGAGSQPIFKDSAKMYKMIDRTILGDVQDMDYQLFREYESVMDKRQWEDFMSGDWAWTQADIISHDSTMHGSTFVPIILGSDKMTVSVTTGQNDYYPLYLSIGNMSNKVHHAHRNSVTLITFLAIPHIMPVMTKPTVMWFGGGHYRHVIFGLGPYIADYEEQVLLACIVCLAMRQELNTDALYQSCEHAEVLIEEFDLKTLWDAYGIVGDTIIIKGTFKDHLVEWVTSYLKTVHGTTKANAILDDIDWRIAAIVPFAGLCCFPEGCHFKQWTGNDSKALMKVYLPAIEGHVPMEIFTYLVHCNVLTEETLVAVQDTINRFHKYREIFRQSGTIQTFSLPCQHAMKHYPDLICLFGAPNGLCTSITKSKHIDAVKDPYRQTNRNKPLGQMLIINQCLDKLVLGSGPCNKDNGEAVDCPTSIEAHVELACTTQMKRARTVTDLAIKLGLSHLPTILEEFLLQQADTEDYRDLCDIPLSERPIYGNKITIVNSAAALFYAPSDISGIGGMWREYIRSSHS
ncbi:hypothetical protein BKA82DRAFT_4332049 [Pisolithus tinctorius]|nr:hypothetical protein BKA82DRAFT_4332049 [Pisolithus tinctorius]